MYFDEKEVHYKFSKDAFLLAFKANTIYVYDESTKVLNKVHIVIKKN